MKKVIITGKKKAEIIEVPDPKEKENWVLVKVISSPMCAEYKAFVTGQREEFLGHEASGEVVEVAQPCRVKKGDRVVVMPQYPCGICEHCLAGEYIYCEHQTNFSKFTGSNEGFATMAQYILKPDWLLPAIPEKISFDHASLACCGLGPTFGAFERMGVNVFDTVLITGLGPVGLGGVINAAYRGAKVIGVDSNKWRANKARELGAFAVINPEDKDALKQVLNLNKGKGVRVSLDCSGHPSAHRLCIDAAARRGQVAFVGEGGDTNVKVSQDLIRKGLTLIGQWHYSMEYIPKMFQLIEESEEVLNKFISHTLPMNKAEEAFGIQLTGECAKILLKPWEV